MPHKRPPPGSRFRELPANADRLAATLEAEVEALLADQRSLLDSMQRARVRAQVWYLLVLHEYFV